MVVANDITTMTSSNGILSMRIAPDGGIRFPQAVVVTSTGTPNMYIDSNGKIFKSTASTYSTEEVDKKLAIKDKLIEKLSERLDKLEKKLKKAK
jgi:hypothetical protein